MNKRYWTKSPNRQRIPSIRRVRKVHVSIATTSSWWNYASSISLVPIFWIASHLIAKNTLSVNYWFSESQKSICNKISRSTREINHKRAIWGEQLHISRQHVRWRPFRDGRYWLLTSICRSKSLSSPLYIPSAESSSSNIFSKAISAEIKLTRARFDDEAIFDGEILALKRTLCSTHLTVALQTRYMIWLTF